MQRIKKNDKVVVVAGKDRKKTGSVLSIDHEKKLVWVKGINIVKKAQKKDPNRPDMSNFIELEKPLALSNVMVASPKTGAPSRVRIEKNDAGKNIRVAIKCGTVLT